MDARVKVHEPPEIGEKEIGVLADFYADLVVFSYGFSGELDDTIRNIISARVESQEFRAFSPTDQEEQLARLLARLCFVRAFQQRHKEFSQQPPESREYVASDRWKPMWEESFHEAILDHVVKRTEERKLFEARVADTEQWARIVARTKLILGSAEFTAAYDLQIPLVVGWTTEPYESQVEADLAKGELVSLATPRAETEREFFAAFKRQDKVEADPGKRFQERAALGRSAFLEYLHRQMSR